MEDKVRKKINDKLISVIIPVYNASDYLKECLDSILRQTYFNLEVLCVDDGSSDCSLDILKHFEKKDSRVKVFSQSNLGPSAARNKALNEASGDYISFVDADDYLESNAYEILMECASQEENWDLLIFGANLIGGENQWIQEKITTSFRQFLNARPGDVVFVEKCARPFLWLHFLKRELIEEPCRLRFNESLDLGEDQVFQFGYVPRAKNVMVIDQKLYNYRYTQNSSLMQLYNSRKIKKINTHFDLVSIVISDWKENGYYEKYKDDLWSWAVEFIFYSIIDFPAEFKREFAIRMIQYMEKNDVEIYLLNRSEIAHYNQMKEWAIDSTKLEDEMDCLIRQIEREKYEINETLNSKAYRIGRLFTRKKDKLDETVNV